METAPTERRSNGFLRTRLSTHGGIQGLYSETDIEKEYWRCLEYYSEVDEVCDEFFKSKGYKNKSKRTRATRDFNAYVRQAKNFYYSAKKLHHRSSGLLYYYSFLNLVKAGLIVHDSSLQGKEFRHGQKATGTNLRDLARHYQSITQSNNKVDVLPKFYEIYFGEELSLDKLNILKLLGYCSDVAYQYETATGLSNRLLPSFLSIKIDNQHTNTYWAQVAISSFNQLRPYRQSLEDFLNAFQEVKVSNYNYNQIYKIGAGNVEKYSFFQARNTHNLLDGGRLLYSPPQADVLINFNKLIQDNYYFTENDFFISLPYSVRNQVQINEIFAIFAIMHHMSELVRYNPSYLELLLNSKEAWLIEGFIESAPPTFLRGIIGWILNKSFVIGYRQDM